MKKSKKFVYIKVYCLKDVLFVMGRRKLHFTKKRRFSKSPHVHIRYYDVEKNVCVIRFI